MSDETINCGAPPEVCGEFFQEPAEAMYYLYLPVNIAGVGYHLPERLKRYSTLINMAIDDFGGLGDYNMYVTAKTMYVTPDCPGNRPGWHIDGFGSGGDINYIWADMNPTEFAIQEFVGVSSDDVASRADIEAQIDPKKIITYPNNTVLRLDETVVHRVSPSPAAGFRSFVKITFSKHHFANAGNSLNYGIDYNWVMRPRALDRNIDHG